jgi:ribosomal protein S27E
MSAYDDYEDRVLWRKHTYQKPPRNSVCPSCGSERIGVNRERDLQCVSCGKILLKKAGGKP